MPKEEQDPRYWIIKSIYSLVVALIFFGPLVWLGSYLADESDINCSIQDFYFTANATNVQSVIYFDVKIENKAVQMGAYYKNITLTFSFVNVSSTNNRSNNVILFLGNYTVPGFHQGIGKDTRRKDFLLVGGGALWGEGTSKAVFRVNLATSVRLKLKVMKGRRYKLLAMADVEVNGTTGKKISDKSIELKHTYNHHISGWLIFGFVMVAICQTFFGLCIILVACCISCARD